MSSRIIGIRCVRCSGITNKVGQERGSSFRGESIGIELYLGRVEFTTFMYMILNCIKRRTLH